MIQKGELPIHRDRIDLVILCDERVVFVLKPRRVYFSGLKYRTSHMSQKGHNSIGSAGSMPASDACCRLCCCGHNLYLITSLLLVLLSTSIHLYLSILISFDDI